MARDKDVSRQVWPVGAAILAIAGGLAAFPAAAADDAQIKKLESMIERLEAQHQADMQQLQAELAQLKAQQGQQAAQVQQTAQTLEVQQQQQAKIEQQIKSLPPAGGPRLIESPTHQFGFTSTDGQNSVAILARLMFDGADYFHTVPEGGVKGAGPGGTAGPLDSGVNARRARLGIGGTLDGDWAYRLIYDFGSSADSVTPGVSGAVTSGVENAYITYNGFYKPNNRVPLAIDLGYLDIPWTMDEASSSNDIMFLERSSSQVVATEFGGGDFRSGFGLRSNDQRYWAGLYVTGPTSGTPHTGADIGTYSTLGRLAYQLYQDADVSVHLGANVAHLFNARANSTTTSATGITDIAANPVLALTDRPELRVDPTTILNTGNIPASSGSVEGLAAAAAGHGFYLQSEYYHYTLGQRPGGVNPSDGAVNKVSPDLNFNGGYVEASYAIGGQRHYIAETGAYSGVVPLSPFRLGEGGGFGAFEFAARYSAIDLNDLFTFGKAPHLTGGVNGGNQKGVDVGINWYPNINVKFMLDYIHTDVTDLYKPTTNGTAQTTPSGATINAVAVRSQFLF